MNAPTEVFSQALNLPSSLREELAMLLFESLPGDDDSPIEISKELEQEIELRIAEREAGTAQVVDLATFASTVRGAAKRHPAP